MFHLISPSMRCRAAPPQPTWRRSIAISLTRRDARYHGDGSMVPSEDLGGKKKEALPPVDLRYPAAYDGHRADLAGTGAPDAVLPRSKLGIDRGEDRPPISAACEDCCVGTLGILAARTDLDLMAV